MVIFQFVMLVYQRVFVQGLCFEVGLGWHCADFLVVKNVEE